jgi:putative membrane protein
MHGYGGMGLGMAWYWIIGVVILVAVVWLISRFFSQNRPVDQSKSALDILKERYARGEIDTKEFEEKRNHLNS